MDAARFSELEFRSPQEPDLVPLVPPIFIAGNERGLVQSLACVANHGVIAETWEPLIWFTVADAPVNPVSQVHVISAHYFEGPSCTPIFWHASVGLCRAPLTPSMERQRMAQSSISFPTPATSLRAGFSMPAARFASGFTTWDAGQDLDADFFRRQLANAIHLRRDILVGWGPVRRAGSYSARRTDCRG